MVIGIDASQSISQSEYRGIGSYTRSVISSLKRYDKINTYKIFNSQSEMTADVDILFIPYFFPFNFSLPRNLNSQYLITIHDLVPLLFPDKFPAGLRGNLIWQIQKQLLRRAIGIITDSEVSKNDIHTLARIPKEKIFTVYPSIGDEFQKINNNKILSKVKSKYKLPDSFILYVGDSNWNKNIPQLIKATISLKRQLVLVGNVFTEDRVDLSHPWNYNLKEVKELIKGNKLISPLGYVPTNDLVGIYNLASLYIQPSRAEGFGLPIIEAMASGCVTVISDIPVFREVANDASIYFNPNSQEELTSKIIKITEDSNLKNQYIQKGIERAKGFSNQSLSINLKKVFSHASTQ